VIATTMFDAFATADLVAADLSSLPPSHEARPDLPIEELRGDRQIVRWEDWEKLDAVERARGRERGKLREKLIDVKEMLAVLE
jgi:adrenodoxin-NADP+ reductase